MKKKKSKKNTQWPPKSNNKNLAALMLTAMSVGCGVVNTSRIGISSSTTKENEIRGKLSIQGSSASLLNFRILLLHTSGQPILTENREILSVMTNLNGEFTFRNIARGEYKVVVLSTNSHDSFGPIVTADPDGRLDAATNITVPLNKELYFEFSDTKSNFPIRSASSGSLYFTFYLLQRNEEMPSTISLNTKVLLFDENGDRFLTNNNSPVEIHSKTGMADISGIYNEGASLNALVVGGPGNSIHTEPDEDGNIDGFYKITPSAINQYSGYSFIFKNEQEEESPISPTTPHPTTPHPTTPHPPPTTPPP